MKRAIYSLSLVLAVGLGLWPYSSAQALTLPPNTTVNTTGRADFHGYMTNLAKNGANDAGALFNTGLVNKDGSDISNAADFIAFYQRALYRNNPDGDPDQAEAAAAYTVAFMMHGPNTTQFFGPDGDANNYYNGLQYAKDNFFNWSQIIMAYDQAAKSGAGWGVRFNVLDTLCHPLYQGNLDYQSHDVFFYEDASNNSCDNEAVVEFVNPPNAAGVSTYFFLLMVCGNPYGSITQLPPPFAYNATAGVNPETTSVRPGQTINVQVTLQTTPTSSTVPAGVLEVYRTPEMNIPGCSNCTIPDSALQTNMNDGGFVVSSDHGFKPGSGIGGESGQNWYWNTNPLPASTNGTANFQLTISNGAVNSFPLKVCFAPSDAYGGKSCATIAMTVKKIRTPYVVAQNGDIQSGGHVVANGTCTQFGGIANVAANLGSYGDYVIAASGSITNSPSSNGAGGGTTLKLGANGGYAEICRPDLLTAALNYSGANDIVGNTFDITGKTGVWRYTGTGVLRITGSITQAVTVVATKAAATVEFDSNVTVSGAVNTSARSLPSLGVIANGNIIISSAVTQLDAYLFSSGGNIDTCFQANSSCSNPLLVNGFLMGQSLTFSRLGAANTTGQQLAERIALSPQLYLNPPLLFGGVATNVSLNSQGEKQPLY